MNRAEHLAWAKERAFELCDEGKTVMAWIAFKHDLAKHPELRDGSTEFLFSIGDKICAVVLRSPSDINLKILSMPGPLSMRSFIEGFN